MADARIVEWLNTISSAACTQANHPSEVRPYTRIAVLTYLGTAIHSTQSPGASQRTSSSCLPHHICGQGLSPTTRDTKHWINTKRVHPHREPDIVAFGWERVPENAEEANVEDVEDQTRVERVNVVVREHHLELLHELSIELEHKQLEVRGSHKHSTGSVVTHWVHQARGRRKREGGDLAQHGHGVAQYRKAQHRTRREALEHLQERRDVPVRRRVAGLESLVGDCSTKDTSTRI